MMESQRYPKDFDGIVAGAPAFHWTGLAATMVSIAQALYPDPKHLDSTVLTREALEKLSLNDSSFVYEPETSEALGFGFRCGFLGFLHMEIVQERLEREFDLDLITTAPNVVYRIKDVKGEIQEIVSPSRLPEPHLVEEFYEPYANVTVFTKSEFVGNIFKLFEERRGSQISFNYASKDTVIIQYQIPLSEI